MGVGASEAEIETGTRPITAKSIHGSHSRASNMFGLAVTHSNLTSRSVQPGMVTGLPPDGGPRFGTQLISANAVGPRCGRLDYPHGTSRRGTTRRRACSGQPKRLGFRVDSGVMKGPEGG